MKRPIQISVQSKFCRLDRRAVRLLFWRLDEHPSLYIGPGELSLAFLDNIRMGALHGQFLGDDSPTDVITFPGDPADGLAGEICIGVERAAELAGAQIGAELLLYLVHGWLHLAGLDDTHPPLRRQMRRAERQVINWLAAASLPVLATSPGPNGP